MPLMPARKLSLLVAAVLGISAVFLVSKREPRSTRSSVGDEAHLSPSNNVSLVAATTPNTNYVIVGGIIDRFQNRKKPWLDYRQDNLELTTNGLVLHDLTKQIGTLESPPLTIKNPAIVVTPVWRQQTPEGSSVKIEVAFSTDKVEWSSLKLVTRDEAAAQTGAALPPGVIYGGKIHQDAPARFVRYRVTIETRNNAAPIFQEVQFLYESIP